MTFDKTQYMSEYRKTKLKRVPLDMPKEKYDEIKNHAAARSETVNGFLKRAADETMKNDLIREEKP